MGIETKKAEFLAIARWACKYANVRIIFDQEQDKAFVILAKREIHLPMRIRIDKMESWIATIIHESMHIKHTPEWLLNIHRDSDEKAIINAIEDERVEKMGCEQLKNLPFFLKKMVDSATDGIKQEELDKINEGMKVLGNLAVKNSRRVPFDCRTLTEKVAPHMKELIAKHNSIIKRVTPSSFTSNLKDYYAVMDKVKGILKLNLPPEPPNPKPKDGKAGKELIESRFSELDKKDKKKKHKEPDGSLDMEGCAINKDTIPLEDNVRDRVKLALKKTLETACDEGNILDTDELLSFKTGDVDSMFYDTKTERKMRTKVYFLMDVSGSMDTQDLPSFTGLNQEGEPTRQAVAVGAFRSLKQVVDELREEDGCDIDSEGYVFGNRCERWKMESTIPYAGGGTNFFGAMQTVIDEVLKEDPSNKRIVVVITDGDVTNSDIRATERLLIQTGQDIRVVFIQITPTDTGNGLFKHKIMSQETANIAIFESFEEAI